MLFLGEVLWGDPENPYDPDYTDAGVAKNMIDAAYVPGRFTIEKLYESTGNLTYGTTMAALNQGMNIVNVLCHGQYTSFSIADDRVHDTDIASLANAPRYGLMYSASCLSGGFDQNDCLGETWLLTSGGGGFFIGNSRYGFNSPGFPGEGPSDYYDQSFFESLFITGFTNLGKAHADAKHEFVAESRSDNYMRYIMYGLNLLGDPEMRLWTDTPGRLDVTFAPLIGVDPQTYSVGVSSGGSPVADATVCLYKSEDIYCVAETDGSGEVDMFIDPITYGPFSVTVTKANFVPFSGEATVVDAVTGVIPTGGLDGGPHVGPNPFSHSLSLSFDAGSQSVVKIDLYDTNGRWIASVPAVKSGDTWHGSWDGRDGSGRRLAPGIYIVKFSTDSDTSTHKVILLK
jgi:hypothetical protein